MIVRSPMTRLLSRRALRTILGLFVLIEAIFLTDKFTSVMETVVRNGGNVLDFAGVMFLLTPQVVDFALPIVLFLGLYLAINGARADNELMICAAAGESWVRVPQLALTYGAAAMMASLLFSGAISPLSAYLLRLNYFDMAAELLLRQINEPGLQMQVREIENRVVIATPSLDGDGRGGLFIFAADPSGTAWRVGKAQDWDVVPENDMGYRLKLDGFREYQGEVLPEDGGDSGLALLPARPPSLAGGPPILDNARIRVRRLDVDFTPDDLVRARDDTRRAGERLLFQSDGPLNGVRILPDGTEVPAPTREFGEILARAIMCLSTAVLAVAAAALSATRNGRFLGLPLGMFLVMAGDIVSRTVLGDAAALGYPAFWAVALGVLAMGVIPLLLYIRMRAEGIVAPTRLTT